MPDRIHTMRKVSTPPFSCVSCVFSCWHYSHLPLGWRLEVDAQRPSPSLLDFALCWRSGKLPILLCKQDSLYSLGSANKMHFRRLGRWKVAPSHSIFSSCDWCLGFGSWGWWCGLPNAIPLPPSSLQGHSQGWLWPWSQFSIFPNLWMAAALLNFLYQHLRTSGGLLDFTLSCSPSSDLIITSFSEGRPFNTWIL